MFPGPIHSSDDHWPANERQDFNAVASAERRAARVGGPRWGNGKGKVKWVEQGKRKAVEKGREKGVKRKAASEHEQDDTDKDVGDDFDANEDGDANNDGDANDHGDDEDLI